MPWRLLRFGLTREHPEPRMFTARCARVRQFRRLQTCAVDLAPVARASSASAGPVAMTSMIGVSVVLACRRAADERRFTVWSDPSHSTYFHSQLQAIAADVSGRY